MLPEPLQDNRASERIEVAPHGIAAGLAAPSLRSALLTRCRIRELYELSRADSASAPRGANPRGVPIPPPSHLRIEFARASRVAARRASNGWPQTRRSILSYRAGRWDGSSRLIDQVRAGKPCTGMRYRSHRSWGMKQVSRSERFEPTNPVRRGVGARRLLVRRLKIRDVNGSPRKFVRARSGKRAADGMPGTPVESVGAAADGAFGRTI